MRTEPHGGCSQWGHTAYLSGRDLEPAANDSDDFFYFDNPAWSKAGVIVPSTGNRGDSAIAMWTSYQHSGVAVRIVAERIG